MKIIAPNYYDKFRCVADKCKHNCCIGWEVDIDLLTLNKYENLEGSLGEKLRANIVKEGGEAHFAMDEKSRCPFLKQDGLCEIICALGEEGLCNICADHPRWRNFFSSHIEIGLGLACEEASRIILSQSDSAKFVTIKDGKVAGKQSLYEKWVIRRRDRILSIATDRNYSIPDRVERIAKFAKVKPAGATDFLAFVRGLERLESYRDQLIDAYESGSQRRNIGQIEAEQLLSYFLMRHLGGAESRRDFNNRVAFCLTSLAVITAVYERTEYDLCEIARSYSAEIEYSFDNLYACIDYQGKKR